MKEVVVYSSSTCTNCKVLKTYLQEKGVDYVEKNISTDKAAKKELIGMGYMAVPVTVIGEEVIVGFDKEKLEEVL